MIFRWIGASLILLLLLTSLVPAQSVRIFPLESVQPGLKGYGKTIFNGTDIETFDFEIMGTLEKTGPDQNIILARLSGELLDRYGVFAGMSGSPVYIDEKLVGAVAYAFSFATEPIAGITPIQEMIDIFKEEVSTSFRLGRVPQQSLKDLYRALSRPRLDALPFQQESGSLAVSGRLRPIETPLSLFGFTEKALEPFIGQLRARSIFPVFGGSAEAPDSWSEAKLEPGSTISVQMVRGDMEVSASGTVTHISGNKIYAFGHPFLGIGYTEMPMATAGVIGVIPTLMNSQKISATLNPIGTMRQDRATGILGIQGREARMIPVQLKLDTSRKSSKVFDYELVSDNFLTPFLLTLTVHNGIVSSERTIGGQTFRLRSKIHLEDQPEINFEMNIADLTSGPALAAVLAAAPVNFILNSGFEEIVLKKIELEIAATEQIQQAVLNKVWQNRTEVKAGEELEIKVFLRHSTGKIVAEKYPVKIPEGIEPGPLKIMIGDGMSMTQVDSQTESGEFVPKNLSQLVKAVNNLKKNDRLYIRLFRDQKGAVIGGEGLPGLPPSILELYNSRKTSGDIRPINKVIYVEHELPATDFVLSGSKVLEIQIKG